jgi:spore maturation protein CgeB
MTQGAPEAGASAANGRGGVGVAIVRGRDVAPLFGLKALAVSPVSAYDGFNTSAHRVRALESLGADVVVVDTALGARSGLARLPLRVCNRLFQRGLAVPLPDPSQSRRRTLEAARRRHFDIIWLEKALTIGPDVVRSLRRLCPRAEIVGFAADDMCLRHNQSQQFIGALPHYDHFITNKASTVAELQALGASHVVVVGNGYDPEAFRPLPVTPADVARLGGDIGFIGSHETARARVMLGLAHAGLTVRVWGDGWGELIGKHPLLRVENRPLYFDEYARACAAFKINLGFLRKLNRDQQTTRSVEIPACGGFLLAERTAEHLAMFDEGVEAELFASPGELLDKCRRYLADDAARLAIARRGHERCLAGYSNAARLNEAFGVILPR